jgi:DNA-binding transcriptional regulator YhcF (GntR family)
VVSYLSTVQIDQGLKIPIYQQISNQFILMIQKCVLKKQFKLLIKMDFMF